MATHFARWTIDPKHVFPPRLSEECINHAGQLPERRRLRFLASRSVLAELLFMLFSDVEDVLVWACTVSPAIEKLRLWEFESPEGWHSLKDVYSRRRYPDGRIIRFTSLSSEKTIYSN